MGVYGVGPPDRQVRMARDAAPAPRLQASEAAREQDERVSTEEQVGRADTGAVSSEPALSFARPRLRVDEASKRVIAQIVNESGEVVKQIPPEEVLRLAANFGRLQGLLFDQQA